MRFMMLMIPKGFETAPAKLDLDAARGNQFARDAQHRASKVRTRFAIPETGVKHFDIATVERDELLALEPLMEPHGLEQLLRGTRLVPCALVFAQERARRIARTPFGVEAGLFHSLGFSGAAPAKSSIG